MRNMVHVFFAMSFVGAACGGSPAPASTPKTAPAEEPWVCTPASKPATVTYGHCDFAMGDAGKVCTQATGSGGADEENARKVCGNVNGTFSPGPCKPSPSGSCLSRCGTSREALDTIYFATAADHQKACEARKGVFVAP